MRVPTEISGETPWSQTISIRISLPLEADRGGSNADYSGEATQSSKQVAAGQCKFTRCSKKSMRALRNLPDEAPITIFTPFLIPVGAQSATPGGSLNHVDPFEPLGRELAGLHSNIQHVPYLPSVGFTETHRAYVLRSSAVITVVCEPEYMANPESVQSQRDFALKVSYASGGKREVVLVHCGQDFKFEPPEELFPNVIGSPTYNEEVAMRLAREIMGFP